MIVDKGDSGHGWALAVVAFGVFVAADDLMVVATMLRPMINDFELVVPDDLDDAAWIVNSYLIAYLAVMPVAGRLSDVFGRRAVFCAALAVFGIGSVVVPTADSLPVLYRGRVLTALGGGALVPIAFAVVGDVRHGAPRARWLGILGAIETFGWVWGPLYGALLVRFLSWRWQFHLNVPLAIVGIAIGWRVLDPASRAGRRIDWSGTVLLTLGLIGLNVAVLSQARIQTVTGLADLTGSGRFDQRQLWLPALVVAVSALTALIWTERRATAPIVSRELVGRAPVRAAFAVNALLGAGLVVALINVPLFVNIVGNDIESSAVRSGWLLTALTAAMAATSYVGGVLAGRYGLRRPTLIGLGAAAAAMATMGALWSPATGGVLMALQLGMVGAGLGAVLAPSTAAVVDAATDEHRGTAAGLVVLSRLIGFSVGLAALTTWSLRRYADLRTGVELPPVTDPGYVDAVATATADVSTAALAETFIGAALMLGVAAVVATGLGARAPSTEPISA